MKLHKKMMPLLRQRLERVWNSALKKWSSGLPYFTTEEHMMSFALSKIKVYHARKEVKRNWTAHSYRTVDGTEDSLFLWHLPAE